MNLVLTPVTGVDEVREGDDLVELLLNRLDEPLRDGEIVVVTSKIVSKALGLVSHGPREDVIGEQTVRVVARRGQTQIVRNRAGLTMAAAGVDASNTAPGTALALPADPDAVAYGLRTRLRRRSHADIGVVIADTAGRAWRRGQTDIAIGSSGVAVSAPLNGTYDTYGNALHVTEPAVVDEIAGAAELVSGKTSSVPFVVVRGLPAEWVGDRWAHTGAAALIRADEEDLFGLGAREAVSEALGDRTPIGFPAPEPDALTQVLALADADPRLIEIVSDETSGRQLSVVVLDDTAAAWCEAGRVAERLRVAARAHGVTTTVEVRRGVEISAARRPEALGTDAGRRLG